MPESVMKCLRTGAVDFELATDVRHVNPQQVGVGIVRRTPHGGDQLAIGHQSTGIAHEVLDHRPLGRRQPDLWPRRRTRSMPDQVEPERRVVTSATDSSASGLRRNTARTRASSSAIPNGLVT